MTMEHGEVLHGCFLAEVPFRVLQSKRRLLERRTKLVRLGSHRGRRIYRSWNCSRHRGHAGRLRTVPRVVCYLQAWFGYAPAEAFNGFDQRHQTAAPNRDNLQSTTGLALRR